MISTVSFLFFTLFSSQIAFANAIWLEKRVKKRKLTVDIILYDKYLDGSEIHWFLNDGEIVGYSHSVYRLQEGSTLLLLHESDQQPCQHVLPCTGQPSG